MSRCPTEESCSDGTMLPGAPMSAQGPAASAHTRGHSAGDAVVGCVETRARLGVNGNSSDGPGPRPRGGGTLGRELSKLAQPQ